MYTAQRWPFARGRCWSHAMPALQKVWDRHEWQRWVSRLLFLKYGHDGYQRVPDKHGGDLGIEGFSRDGCAYQCYVADEPASTKSLYEKQRDKVTSDLQKFTSNASELATLLAPTRIRTWVLVVPRYESAPLLMHCAGKADEIRKVGLPYVADDFVVHVCDDEPWEVYANQLRREGLDELTVTTAKPAAKDIEAWAGANTARVQTLRSKAERLTLPNTLDRFVHGSVRAYIQGQNAYERLRDDLPEVCDDVLRIKDALEEQLETDCAVSAGPRVTYRDVEARFSSRLLERWPKMSPELRTRLVAEAMADWLLRCPLYFEDDHATD